MLIRKLLPLIVTILVASYFAPVVPQEMKWITSYETLRFATKDGDLALNQYAEVGNGLYYVRTLPKKEARFMATTSLESIQDKSKVAIVCEQCAYYHEFTNSKGRTVRVSATKEEYDGMRFVKNYPQPNKKEWVSLPNAGAAIAHDSSTYYEIGDASSYTFSHTVAEGDDRLLYLGATGAAFDCSATDCDVTSVTYNGDAMTSIRLTRTTSSGGDVFSEIFYLVAPDTGSNTVAVTLAATINAGNSACAVSLTGVDQSDPLDADNGASHSFTNTVTVNVTTVADDAWVLDTMAIFNDRTATLAEGADQTSRCEAAEMVQTLGTSTEGPIATPGAVTMSWSWDAATKWVTSAASFAPVVVGGGADPSVPAIGTSVIKTIIRAMTTFRAGIIFR